MKVKFLFCSNGDEYVLTGQIGDEYSFAARVDEGCRFITSVDETMLWTSAGIKKCLLK